MLDTARVRGEHRYLASLDLASAFDSVEVWALEDSLLRLGFDRRFVRWVRSAYTGLSACALTPHGVTDPFSLSSGVRQGDPLSPLLFLCVMDSGLELVSSAFPDCAANNLVRAFAYADDVLLVGDSLADLQAMVARYSVWLRRVGLRLNARKCVLFSTHGPRTPHELTFDTVRVTQSPTMRYLGVVFDTRGTWVAQRDVCRRVILAWSHRLARKALSLEMLVAVVNGVVVPKVAYALAIASPASWSGVTDPLTGIVRRAGRLASWSTPAVRLLIKEQRCVVVEKTKWLVRFAFAAGNSRLLGLSSRLGLVLWKRNVRERETWAGLPRGGLLSSNLRVPPTTRCCLSLFLAQRLRAVGLRLARPAPQRVHRLAHVVRGAPLPRAPPVRLSAGTARAARDVLPAPAWCDVEVLSGAATTRVDAEPGQAVKAWTDGSTVSRRSGVGVYLLWGGNRRRALCARLPPSARPRNYAAELLAVLLAVSVVPPECPLVVYTDSLYCKGVLMPTLQTWLTEASFKLARIANAPLVASALRALGQRTADTQVKKVRAHTGAADAASLGNEFADWLARLGSAADLPVLDVSSWATALDRVWLDRVDTTILDSLDSFILSRDWKDSLQGLLDKPRQGAVLRRYLQGFDAGQRPQAFARWRQWFTRLPGHQCRLLGKVLTGTLPTTGWWGRFDRDRPHECVLCEGGRETAAHLFLTCSSLPDSSSICAGRDVSTLAADWARSIAGLDRSLEDGPAHTFSDATRNEWNMDTWSTVHAALGLWPQSFIDSTPWAQSPQALHAVSDKAIDFLQDVWRRRNAARPRAGAPDSLLD